jgi:hypothetical protein
MLRRMISLALFFLALPAPTSVPAALPPPLARIPVASTVHVSVEDDIDSLSSAYDEAVAAWSDKMVEARKLKKADEVRKQHPIHEYYPKFEKLAGKGDGQALLWMATHVQETFDKDKEKKECTAKKLELFGKLVKDQAGQDWSANIASALGGQGRWLEAEQSDKLLLELAANPKASKDTAATALASVLARLEANKKPADADKKRADELRARLMKDYDGTKVVDRLKAADFKDKNLQDGMSAPDFTTKDVEDVEFKLSDYKGKVVLLDFWGFW